MIRPVPSLWVVLASAAILLSGCTPTQPFHFYDDGDLSHFVDVATQIEYPDVKTPRLDEVAGAHAPFTIENLNDFQPWDLTLEEAIKISLANSKVMRTLGGRFQSTAQIQPALGGAPEVVTNNNAITVYDPAIVETTPFVGVESALSAFDAQLTTNLFWEKNDRPQNVRATGQFGNFFTPVFDQHDSTFNLGVQKTTATGGTVALRHNVFYDQNNNPTRQVPSDYNVNFEAQFNQPLLAGSGVQFNRIAGPSSPFGGNGSLAFDGVMLARINTDISLADFEVGVRNLASDVENAYWDLYFDYRNLEATRAGEASALQTWRKVHALYVVGGKGGDAAQEAQAREQYFFFRSAVQTALNNLLREEMRMRYILGIAVNDCRLIRPATEPTTAEVSFDWCEVHCEGLSRSVELRRQKWRIKQRELELIAARNQLLPRLDFVSRYRWLGLGDQLINSGGNPGGPGLIDTNAWQSLVSGGFQEWQLGFQGTMPIGFRRELSTVRHYQLQLARERARMEDSELEVSHQIADSLRSLTGQYVLIGTQFNRRVAAQKQVDALMAQYESGALTLDLLLDAQRRRADAEIAYYRSLVDYNRSIGQVHFRKGSLLEYNNVYLAEGPWPAKAQFDALKLARQRDASFYLDYGFTRPRVVSQGPYQQHSGLGPMSGEDGMPVGEGGAAMPETVPAPTPQNKQTAPQTLPEPSAGGSGPSLGNPSFRTASAQSGSSFEWGGLGLTNAAAATASSSKRNQSPVVTAAHFSPSTTSVEQDQVRGVDDQSWNGTSRNEPAVNRTTRSAGQSTAGWQGTWR